MIEHKLTLRVQVGQAMLGSDVWLSPRQISAKTDLDPTRVNNALREMELLGLAERQEVAGHFRHEANSTKHLWRLTALARGDGLTAP